MNVDNLKGNDITQKGELARRQLIAAALVLFSENGLEGASTREIARKAQQNIGAIAYYFQSKEGLYLAVAHHINDFIQQEFNSVFQEIEAFINSDTNGSNPERYLIPIKKIIHFFCSLLTQHKTLNFSKFIIREQLSPTAAFHIIHENALSPIHINLTHLIARYIGIPEDSTQAILHSHAIIGETLAFRFGRETFLRRVGWKKLDEAETTIIAETLIEHIELILRGLRAKYRHS